MKKILISLLLIVSLLGCLASCFESDNGGDQGSGSASSGTSNSSLGNYEIVIQSCRLATDYQGDAIIIVKYKYTNNDSDPTAFYLAVNAEAYQDGIGLNECYFPDDSANYSSDNQMKEIKQGATLYVEVAYTLNNTTSDVEIEVEELFSWSSKKITKTFSIK